MKITTTATKPMTLAGKKLIKTKIVINDLIIEQARPFINFGNDIGCDKHFVKFETICATISLILKQKGMPKTSIKVLQNYGRS